VIPVEEIGTEPTRAASFKRTEALFAPPVLYAFDTPLPVPGDARPLPVPVSGFPEDRINGWAHGSSQGGYKVPSLVGLAWSAPYLHDGGVAVGADPTVVGVQATRGSRVTVDPANSLRALLDRVLREQVVQANARDPALAAMHIGGEGHAYWVDLEAGYTVDEQQALIDFLLSLRHDPNASPARPGAGNPPIPEPPQSLPDDAEETEPAPPAGGAPAR
jgi:hypothetical protein